MPDGWIQVDARDGRWTVQADWQPRLLNPEGLRWREWREAHLVELIKDAGHRSVYRVMLPGQAIFIKHYPTSDWRSRLRQWIRPTKAYTEWRRAVAIAQMGLTTVLPLAYGETPDRQSYLVTQEWPDAQTLDQWLLQNASGLQNPAARRSVTRTLAELLARMHDAGVEHGDLHPGNLLCRTRQDGSLELAIIDLYAVRLKQPLSLHDSLKNLAMFGHWFLQRTSPTDRHRFWTVYGAARKTLFLPPCPRTMIDSLEQQCWEGALAVWHGRSRRCLGDNKDFYRLRVQGQHAWAVRDIPPSWLEEIALNPDRPFANDGSQIVKHSKSSTVAKCEPRQSQHNGPILYKRFMPTKWHDPVQHLFRSTPAMRSWINAFRLINMGLPTPRPLALVHRRRFGMTWESYLITDWLPDAEPLHRWAEQWGPSDSIGSKRRDLLCRLASLLRQLHRLGLSHRDMKASNFLVQHGATPHDPFHIYFIDLVGITQPWRLTTALKVQNLARLWISFQSLAWLSRTDRLRFLLRYLAEGRTRPERTRWKSWWRMIDQAAQRKIRQNHRRNRPLS